MLAHPTSSFFTKIIFGLAFLVGLFFLVPSLTAVPLRSPLVPDAPPLANGLIAFIAHENGSQDLYVMNPNGTGLQRLTDTPRLEHAPLWSPDGQSIIYEVGRDIYRLRLSDMKSRIYLNRIGPSQGIQDLKWSPDGTQVLFHLSCADMSAHTLYVMNADSSNPRCLEIGGLTPLWSAWSPDSTQIVFTASAEAGGQTDIYSIAADGGNLRQLTQSVSRDVNPQWSPDGTQIYFMAYHPGLNPSSLSLYVMEADGENLRPFFRRERGGCGRSHPEAAAPREEYLWSVAPDGRHALVTTRQDTTHTLMVVDLNTYQPIISVSSEDEAYWDVMWSPDSESVLYRTDGLYYVMQIDGPNIQPLSLPFAHVSGVAWQPVGR